MKKATLLLNFILLFFILFTQLSYAKPVFRGGGGGSSSGGGRGVPRADDLPAMAKFLKACLVLRILMQ
jgi:hypothetical protein